MSTIRAYFAWVLAVFLIAAPYAHACEKGGNGGEAGAGAALRCDAALLGRFTWGVTPSSLSDYQVQGRQAFVRRQLKPGPEPGVPGFVQARLDGLRPLAQSDRERVLEYLKGIQDTARFDRSEDRAEARRALRPLITGGAAASAERQLLYAIYSPNQLQERMVWFWLNHFSVRSDRANTGIYLPGLERKVREHALGKFGDLLVEMVRSPAMLTYLDNTRNRVGRINENYARELMELHTLGVGGGYSQQDVQELARILTGLGTARYGEMVENNTSSPRARDIVWDDGAIFRMRDHDRKPKNLLGKRIDFGDFRDITAAASVLAAHPSTARFISNKLAQYFLADTPPDRVIDEMAKAFSATEGDIAATLQAMLEVPEAWTALAQPRFKSPVEYILSSLRLLAEQSPPIVNGEPARRWLARLGQPYYGRRTPDGYPLDSREWVGSGQLTGRIEIATVLARGGPAILFSDGQGSSGQSFTLRSELYDGKLSKLLGDRTIRTLSDAGSVRERNLYLLSSPEFMNH